MYISYGLSNAGSTNGGAVDADSAISKRKESQKLASKRSKRMTKAALVSMYEKKVYDLEQLLDIARSFSSSIDTAHLLESISFSCMAQLHVLDAGVFVLDFLTSDYFVLKTKKSEISVLPADQSRMNEDFWDSLANRSANVTVATKQISFNDPVVKYLANKAQPVTLQDIRANISEESAGFRVLTELAPTLVIPLILRDQISGILFLGERFFFGEDSNIEASYSDYDKSFVLSIASLAASAVNNAVLIERSSTDMMTQLKLKYFFFNVLTEKLSAANNDEKNIAVMMFDIDFFKHFNDTYGHEFGDYVLKQVAAIIKQNVVERQNPCEGDLASRYGGEEFTVMLYDAGKLEGVEFADKIRSDVEAYDFCYHGRHVHVTISGGVSVFDYQVNPIRRAQKIVSQADQGLYLSKQNGRNRITFAEPDLQVVG